MNLFKSLLVVLALGFGVSFATAEEAVFDNCKVVKVEGDRLFVSKDGGSEHSAPVASDVKITVDGKNTKLADLKSGTKIKLTVQKGDGKITIMKIEGTSKSSSTD